MELNEWHQLQQRVGTVENIVEARTRAGLPILPNQGQDQPSRNGPMVRKTRKSAQAEAAAAAAAASSSKSTDLPDSLVAEDRIPLHGDHRDLPCCFQRVYLPRESGA